jgi:hypothetical protein
LLAVFSVDPSRAYLTRARPEVLDMHVAFQIPYVYDYITKLCRRQAQIIHNHENENVRNI